MNERLLTKILGGPTNYVELPIYAWKGRNKIVAYALVDDDYDGEYFGQFKWFHLPSGYVLRPVHVKKNGVYTTKYIYLHRQVLKPPKGYWVSHKNRNRLDNRSENLELITPSESAAQRPLGRKSSWSKYRGVKPMLGGSGYINLNRWLAQCAHDKLGWFDTPEEAAKAYDEAAYAKWGERAQLNFPKESNNA